MAAAVLEDALTIDVEDWFHILDLKDAPSVDRWEALPSRVERNFDRLLALLAERGARATCFFLGWIAEKYPQLVRAAQNAGHEIACHGYAHELVYEQGESSFYEDVRRAKGVLEDLAGTPVWGYRAPGFSITASTPWAFERLARAGYRYDTSVFPATRGHGGLSGATLGPSCIPTASGDIVEFPISLAPFLGRRVCFFGGGYLRLSPYPLIRRMAERVHREGRRIVFYIHPRDIDPDQPRLSMGLRRRFKSYVNLRGTEAKLGRLLTDFRFRPLRDHFVEFTAQHATGEPVGADR